MLKGDPRKKTLQQRKSRTKKNGEEETPEVFTFKSAILNSVPTGKKRIPAKEPVKVNDDE
ncbi:OLC1v1005364C1, partial [Oldenlandia corymbosa var. corymbosa]